jgi:hypothetical protein
MSVELSNATITTLQTTYYDDFSESKQFYRILFRPSVAVQARELTQLQTILQTQIQRFGDHVFKDGSVVDGCALTYHSKLPYVILSDNFNSNTASPANIDDNYLITNGTSNNYSVRAVVKVAKSGFLSNYPNSNRYYLDYIKTGKTGANNDIDVDEFASGDVLRIYSSAQDKLGVLDANNLVYTINVFTSNATSNATGYGYGVTVSDGVIYQKGFFSKVNKQTTIVRDFDTNPNNYVVGFETTEAIVTENQDTSLNDNASGFFNYNAPGAHRLKLSPTLVSKTRSDTANNKNFFAIAEFDGTSPAEQNIDPVYNKLGEEFARRTYEESGDYVVNPFQIDSYASSNSSTFYYEVSPGIAYVNGYRVELINSKKIEVDRAVTTDVAQNQVVTANYGNYVVCQEFLGTMNFDAYGQVELYDTAQQSISEIEGISGAPAGTRIGYANVRNVQYASGTKGKPNCLFYVYLFNIRMDSGRSFANVKSIYGNNTYGKFRADLVTEGGVAVLKDATKNTLIFNTGLSGIRRLTNNTGVNDTSFVYRQTTSGTLQSNGYAVFTLNTPAAGGTERLNYSVGTLSDTAEQEFNIILTANAYTANLTGTITVTSGNTTVVGSGTLFSSEISANDIIRVGSGGAAYYRVTAVNSNTSITIAQTPAASYSANVYQRFFNDGTVLPTAGSPSITIISNTQFSVSTGLTIASGTPSVYAQFPVLRTTAVGTAKQIKKNRLVKIDCSNNAATSVGPWDLGLTDIAKVNNIYVGTTYANTNSDRLSWFVVDNGQRDDMYDHGKLYIRPEYASNLTGSSKILVDLDHFVANTSAGAGFFSVDSYPVSNTANSTTINYAEIPRYQGAELRNAIDFRAVKYSTANSVANTDPANTQITINPAVSNTSFIANSTVIGYLAEVDSNFTADIEFYLPRRDIVTVNKEGDLAVRKGLPKIDPILPFNERDTVAVAEVFVPAFPTLTIREGDSYSRRDISTRINIKANRRYTMRDIGALEERIKRLEYYTVLSALEQQAKDMTIPDTNGLDRFKNGIFADPFNSHGLGNVTDFEYKISVDKDKSIARPRFDTHPLDFKFNANSSSGVTKTGSIVTLPYSHETYVRQPFATKYRNCTESVWSWNGKLDLYPSFDYYRNTNITPNQNITLDFSAPWQDFANSPFGTTFGDWRTVSSRVTSTSSVSQNVNVGRDNWAPETTTFTTTSSTQQQIVSTLAVDTLTQNYDLGSYVSDFSIQPYMRSRLVAFVAYNMKPNSTLHAFFDDVLVDAHCAPGVLSGITNPESGKEDRVVNQKGNFGAALVSDASGFICGIFKIPEETFRTGDRVFRLANVNDLVTGESSIITSGRATFSASNISVSKTSATITTRSPDLKVSSNTVTRVVSNVSVAFAPARRTDPIAQSFFATVPGITSGLFLTKVGVYFYSKDPVLGITCYVMEMRNGFPDTSNIIAKSYLASSSVNTSSNGQTETVFVLEQPVMLTSNKQYAFMIQPDGDSPEYQIWMGETGGIDVSTGEQVYSNPYSGIAFVSANRESWTPLQKEDVKFNLYRARFTTGTGTAVFENEDDEYLTVDGFVRANSAVAIEIGDVVYTANSTTTLTSNTSPQGIIQYIDEGAGKIYLDRAVAGFSSTSNPTIKIYRTSDPSNTSLIAANTLIATANVTSVDNLYYSAVVPKFASIEPIRTQLGYSFAGTDTSYNTDTAYRTLNNGYELEYIDNRRMAVSRTNESTYHANTKTSFYSISFFSESDLVSPVIDLISKSSLLIENKINANTTNEHTRYGYADAKYVSKIVQLANGQEAEDIKVMMSAYRPVGTDVKVYVKFRNEADGEVFDSKVWSELSYQNGGEYVYSDPLDVTNYVEYELGLPTANVVAQGAFSNTTTGILQYTNSAGEIFYDGYKYFALKIVLTSDNSAIVPRLNDVRAIALQV